MRRSQPSRTSRAHVIAEGRPGTSPRQDRAAHHPVPPPGGSLRQLGRWARRHRRAVSDRVDARPDETTTAPEARPGRVVLTHRDLLWFKTSEDEEGRITLGLLECSREAIGVLVDDNGESLGLLLSRTEAQDLHRTLVAWLAGTTESESA